MSRAKAEAWDEGYKDGINSEYYGYAVSNPYKTEAPAAGVGEDDGGLSVPPDNAAEAAVLATAISYAEDQAMAGAYFPEWQTCADMLRVMCEHRGIPIDTP